MHSVSREKLIQVCSELVGKELVIDHQSNAKHFALRVKDTGEIIAHIPKSHGGRDNDLTIKFAQQVLRQAAKGDQKLFEEAKKKLRN